MSVFDDPPKNPTAQRPLNLTLKTVALLSMTVLPAFITTLPPVTASRIKLQREDGRVTAVSQRFMFFVIPYRTERIDPVVAVETDSQTGSTTRERRTGQPNKTTKADDQGYILVKGSELTSKVPADARKLESLRSQAKSFMQDPQAKELNLYLLGNPLFSLVFGGGATALVLLIAGCFLIALVQWILRLAGLGKSKRQ